MAFRVRRLAAIDMYGMRGTVRRRRLVLAEFLIATLCGVGLAVFLLVHGDLILGSVLLGVGFNYLILSIHAVRFSNSVRLRSELESVGEKAAELRTYGLWSLALFVPGLVFVLALRPDDWSGRAGR